MLRSREKISQIIREIGKKSTKKKLSPDCRKHSLAHFASKFDHGSTVLFAEKWR